MKFLKNEIKNLVSVDGNTSLFREKKKLKKKSNTNFW